LITLLKRVKWKPKMAKSSIQRKDKTEGRKPGQNSMNPDRDKSALKGVAKPRTAGTIKRLAMYKNFKAKRNAAGKVIKAAPYQGYVDSGTRAKGRTGARMVLQHKSDQSECPSEVPGLHG